MIFLFRFNILYYIFCQLAHSKVSLKVDKNRPTYTKTNRVPRDFKLSTKELFIDTLGDF